MGIEMKKGSDRVNQETDDSERKKEKENGDGGIEEPQVMKEKEKQDALSEKVKFADENNREEIKQDALKSKGSEKKKKAIFTATKDEYVSESMHNVDKFYDGLKLWICS